MSESVKPRFAVDLNEIERQLAQAGNPQPQQAHGGRNDPLAELARIVGQDDPFQSILANDGSARPRQQGASIDDLFAVRDTMTQTRARCRSGLRRPFMPCRPTAMTPILRATFGIMSRPMPSSMPRSPRRSTRTPTATRPMRRITMPIRPRSIPTRITIRTRITCRSQKPRSRKGAIAIAAVVGAVVLGGGGAYLASRLGGDHGGRAAADQGQQRADQGPAAEPGRGRDPEPEQADLRARQPERRRPRWSTARSSRSTSSRPCA